MMAKKIRVRDLKDLKFNIAELTLLPELLRIAQASLQAATRQLEKDWPTSSFTARLHDWTSQCISLRERIEHAH